MMNSLTKTLDNAIMDHYMLYMSHFGILRR